MNQPIAVRGPDRHPAPRPRRASLLWLIGAGLLVYSIAIEVTGGIDVTIAALRIRSRSWERPAALGALCILAVAVSDRRRASSILQDIVQSAGRGLDTSWTAMSPRAVAAGATAWTLAAGIAFGTDIAGGADSSGYLNQARLFARGRLMDVSRLDVRPLDTPHRPSVDVLFQSAAEVYGDRVLGVVMSGMGSDGRDGAAWIKARGGDVLTEAEETCVVYGMPRAIVEAGLSDEEIPLDRLSSAIIERV